MNNKRERKEKIISVNPPFSKSINNNVCKIFLQLLLKHFPKNHTMHKIFNRNKLKYVTAA